VVSAAAAEATLNVMETEPVFETINARGLALMAGFHEILNRHNVPHAITGVPALFGVMVGNGQNDMPMDFRAALKYSDDALSQAITAGLRERGILPDPDYAEPWFMCYTHSDQDIAETLTAYEEVVREVTK
jgi:glutamate-1-semialdehyde aminotransferase